MRLVGHSEGARAAETARKLILACGYPIARRKHVQACAAFLLSLTMAACAHTAPSAALPCLPMRTWAEPEKAALKAAYDALPAGSIMRLAVEDLTKLRAENRAACAP